MPLPLTPDSPTEKSKDSEGSRQSQALQFTKLQAAAEAAAKLEVLNIIKEQHKQEKEIQRLELEDEMLAAEIEAENSRKRAWLIAESATRKIQLEERKKEVND